MLPSELINYPSVNGLPQLWGGGGGGSGKPHLKGILLFQPISNRAFVS